MGKLSSSHFTEAETCTPGAGQPEVLSEASGCPGGAWPGRRLP